MNMKERELIALRTRSWKILSVTLPPTLGIFGTVAALKGLESGGARDFWYVVATLLALAALIQRILSSRVLLEPTTLTVINPVFTYSCPREFVRWPVVGSDGGLEIHLRDGSVINSFAFGGSLISRALGTGSKAVGEISDWLNTPRGEVGDEIHVPRRELTRTLLPELTFALAALFAVVGLVIRTAA
ncbi:hypothetical protein OG594_18280 [Streptomyces sp. NBC_01214]|uniref:hypothetical protein n=1 Tax=Streptomyces sp. NBC_01214 TaxID=2903777 RepID=UPI00225BE2B9|nr:hypothetical protein [Streptomyces sp. NBC_01214]MCX4803574.1 hypothetical protein [Streptomyces sp. NBC_01214]